MSGRWLSKPAVLWVLYDAEDVPAHLLSTLIVYAVHAGTDGRGAHPGASTVATLTRKGERRAKRDIAELERLGMLVPGDQRIVAHIRRDRRPKVYDLPTPRGVLEDTPYGSRGASGRTPHDGSRGGLEDTPLNGHGVSSRTARGVLEVPDGVVDRTPEEVLKTSGTRARDASGADAPRALTEQPCAHGTPGGPTRCALCRRGIPAEPAEPEPERSPDTASVHDESSPSTAANEALTLAKSGDRVPAERSPLLAGTLAENGDPSSSGLTQVPSDTSHPLTEPSVESNGTAPDQAPRSGNGTTPDPKTRAGTDGLRRDMASRMQAAGLLDGDEPPIATAARAALTGPRPFCVRHGNPVNGDGRCKRWTGASPCQAAP